MKKHKWHDHKWKPTNRVVNGLPIVRCTCGQIGIEAPKLKLRVTK